ncbi:MAG TPA: glycosyltransferase family 4 protein [Candidatus Saccharimonadales bacterium]|nr:glycosyltransferase family 4 protein [Candidatus Saccharimonadales bacterium]
MTDPIDIELLAQHRPDRKSLLLMQHDNEWLAEISGEPQTTHLMPKHAEKFSSGIWGIMAVSSWVKQVIAQRYGINCYLVPNGVDTKLFHPVRPIIDTPTPKILLMYAPQDWKGFPEAVSAALEVSKTHGSVEIMIVGGMLLSFPAADPAYQQFSFPVTVFNIPEQENLASIYSAATVFVSTSWQEGFGMPGLEALACGVPLVTTDSGGVRDYAIPDKTAIVVPPRDVQAMADGIRRVLDSRELRQRLSQEGLHESKKFTWDKTLDKLERVLKDGKLSL